MKKQIAVLTLILGCLFFPAMAENTTPSPETKCHGEVCPLPTQEDGEQGEAQDEEQDDEEDEEESCCCCY